MAAEPQNKNKKKKPFKKKVAVGLTAIFAAAVLAGCSGGPEKGDMSYTDLVKHVNDGKVTEMTITGNAITGEIDGKKFKTIAPPGTNFDGFVGSGIDVSAQNPPGPSMLSSLGGTALSALIFAGIFLFVMSRMSKGAGGGAMQFGKNRAKKMTEVGGKVTFDDVAGIDDVKDDLFEVVDFLKNPGKYQELGAKTPKGVLMVGPPGTGKTLTARAIAGEADVPFFTISGSDFVEMFVGVGASRVRDMFAQAKKEAPCIIFIDEIDAVGRKRGAGMGGGHDEREQTLNQILVELDGFEDNENVILIAATNRPDVLDPALLRPGRFDRQVVLGLPDVSGREAILKTHMKKVPYAETVDIRELAKGTPGFSGADLANLVNEAAIMASRRQASTINMADFENAKDKIMMGAPRESLIMSQDEKIRTAFHEAGHALIALKKEESDPIYKATIVPRGRALGYVMRLPEGDKVSMTFDQIKADMAVAFGGRVVEEMMWGKGGTSTGASNDIEQATNMAKRMVKEWGFSPNLAQRKFGGQDQAGYLGMMQEHHEQISPELEQKIDAEIDRFITEAYEDAKNIVETHKDELKRIAEALLEHETLTGEEIAAVARGDKIEATLAKTANDNRAPGGDLRAKARKRASQPKVG